MDTQRKQFLTAQALGLGEDELVALIATLALLEGGRVRHLPDVGVYESYWDAVPPAPKFFNMNHWAVEAHGCGTACCIGGTADALLGRRHFEQRAHQLADQGRTQLLDLFYPHSFRGYDYSRITPAQAAAQLRKYLTKGTHDWARP
jgi:hypothetical protein